jgi:glycolate oxidase iron-sulfur subunit
MKAALDGRTPIDATFRAHMDSCLGCLSCVTACPSGVQYGRLIESTRPAVERSATRSTADRFYRRLLFALFPHPRRLRILAMLIRAAQATGAQRIVRALGLTRLLPARLAALERLTPALVPADRVPEVVAAVGERRATVGMLLGCVQREFFPAVNAATARVLAAEGCEVHAPAAQPCCGALLLHTGLVDAAKDCARRMVDTFDLTRLDRIVINAAGCGSVMKEYGLLLRDDPGYAEKARRFSERCVDIAEMLGSLEPRAQRHPIPLRVAYHDACHLQHGQGIRAQPRRLLGAIPQLELKEIREAEICCGSAGVYNLLEPGPAAELRDRKVARILESGGDVLVSSNPGCLMQIASGLESAGRPLPVLHLIELIDRSIRQAPIARPDPSRG